VEADLSAIRKIANWIGDMLGAIWRWILKLLGIRPVAAEVAFKPWGRISSKRTWSSAWPTSESAIWTDQ
jgi:hypothetical protein